MTILSAFVGAMALRLRGKGERECHKDTGECIVYLGCADRVHASCDGLSENPKSRCDKRESN